MTIIHFAKRFEFCWAILQHCLICSTCTNSTSWYQTKVRLIGNLVIIYSSYFLLLSSKIPEENIRIVTVWSIKRLKGLVSKESVVPGQWGNETLKLGIKHVQCQTTVLKTMVKLCIPSDRGLRLEK